MVSILDMTKKNPYCRLSEDFNENYCRDLSLKLFQNEERFKLLDIKAYQKCKLISQLIKSNIEDRLDREWFISGVSQQINAISWPKEFRKIVFTEDLLSKDIKPIKKSLRIKT